MMQHNNLGNSTSAVVVAAYRKLKQELLAVKLLALMHTSLPCFVMLWMPSIHIQDIPSMYLLMLMMMMHYNCMLCFAAATADCNRLELEGDGLLCWHQEMRLVAHLPKVEPPTPQLVFLLLAGLVLLCLVSFG